MSARNAMIHRCTVQRDASHGEGGDAWGQDEPAVWETHLEDAACRFWFDSTRTVIDGSKSSELTTRKLIMPRDADVTEDDRILSVVDRRGRTLADGPMRIDAIGHRDGHLVLTMVDVR